MPWRAAPSTEIGGWRSKGTRESRRAARGEKGFTLIELLIVVSVMPIIVGAITGGLFTVLSLQNTTANRLADTSDGQVISSTFIKDVQSATFITTLATSSPQCDSSAGYTQLLGLQWGNSAQDIASGSPLNPSTLVSYDIVPVTGGSTTTYSLVRELCTGGNFVTPSSSTTVSYDIIGTGPNKQAPPCYSSANCSPTIFNTPIGWTSPSATVPNSTSLIMPVVKFVITEANSKIVFTMTANSLSWTPAAANGNTVGPPFSPLTLLSQASGTVLNMSPGSILTITGTGTAGTTAAIASPNDSSVSIPGDADLTATTVFTEDPNLMSLSGAGLGVLTQQYFASSIPDPLASTFNSTTAPPATSAWPLSPTSCSVSGLVYTCGSGLYTTDPAFPSGSTVNFNAGFGNYEFANPFVIPANSTINFGEGDYVFDGSPAIRGTPPPADQTISVTSSPPASPSTTSPNNKYTPVATSTSGLPVTFTSTRASVCTIAGGVVTFTANGTCLVNANQAGNPSFNPADQIQQVIPIPKSSKTTQTITFTSTSPSPAAINSTYTPTATAPGGTVTITASGTGVCTMTGAVVTFTAAGTCLINASQGGTGTYLQAPVAQQAVVVSIGSGATTITGNNVLFYVRPSGGSIDFGSGNSVDLTPLTTGLSIWDASSNSASSVTINNVADNRNTYGGIYIPGGNVIATSSSFSGTMSVMFIVAQELSMGSSTTLNVTGP